MRAPHTPYSFLTLYYLYLHIILIVYLTALSTQNSQKSFFAPSSVLLLRCHAAIPPLTTTARSAHNILWVKPLECDDDSNDNNDFCARLFFLLLKCAPFSLRVQSRVEHIKHSESSEEMWKEASRRNGTRVKKYRIFWIISLVPSPALDSIFGRSSNSTYTKFSSAHSLDFSTFFPHSTSNFYLFITNNKLLQFWTLIFLLLFSPLFHFFHLLCV